MLKPAPMTQDDQFTVRPTSPIACTEIESFVLTSANQGGGPIVDLGGVGLFAKVTDELAEVRAFIASGFPLPDVARMPSPSAAAFWSELEEELTSLFREAVAH